MFSYCVKNTTCVLFPSAVVFRIPLLGTPPSPLPSTPALSLHCPPPAPARLRAIAAGMMSLLRLLLGLEWLGGGGKS
eukprot:827195-Amorphochlora_amoeboformis.AAC.1